MHISPPIILSRKSGETYADWVVRCMPIDKERDYPVNPSGAWHGGIHIPHTDTTPQANPVRAIADGIIIYARYPSENKDKYPLNYNGKTDDGCVFIRHEILIGDNPVLFIFYSLTMHMKQVRSEILLSIGKQVKREQILGTSGSVDGKNAFHFQICCEQKMLEVLCGRSHGYLNITKPGRDGPVYGQRYYFIPPGTSVHEGSATGISEPPIYITTEPMYIINEGGQTKTLKKNSTETFESVGNMYLVVNYICEPSVLQKNMQRYSEWVKIAISGGTGWVDVASATVKTYSDCDLPDWVGWTIVDDDHSVDSQCNSKIIKEWQSKFPKETNTESFLTHSVCQFPFEWDASTFDARFSWVKTKTQSLPKSLTKEEYSELKKHIGALCFFDQLLAENQKELSGQIWHFEPRMFITHIQQAERRLIFESRNKMNDFSADDMQHGDMTKEQILAQGKINIYGKDIIKFNRFYFDKTEEEHFESMNNMAYWTAWGKYSPLIKVMIEKFKKGDGGILRHDLMNKAFIEHVTTKNCVDRIKQYISETLHSNEYNSLSLNDLKKIKDSFNKSIIGVKLPKFDDWDWFNGLGITIHDTYSTKIYLDYLNINDQKFEAKLSFKIQDHFGLDILDLNGKGFELLEWFCSWFILQRYKEYKHKPFINEVFFSFIIKG